MTARKCDRCKGYFDIDSKRSEVKIAVRDERPIEIDLCPDCTGQLVYWINNEAEFLERKISVLTGRKETDDRPNQTND